jgi:predicted amidohydrolase YtcJ
VNVPRGKSWTTWRAVQDQLVIALIALTERCTGEQRARHAQHLASAMSEGMRSAVAQRREAREPKLPEKKRRPPRAG